MDKRLTEAQNVVIARLSDYASRTCLVASACTTLSGGAVSITYRDTSIPACRVGASMKAIIFADGTLHGSPRLQEANIIAAGWEHIA